jgi:hypothetical protein
VIPEFDYVHQPMNAPSEPETEDKENKKNLDMLINIKKKN